MRRNGQCGQVKDGIAARGKKQIVLLETGELAKQVRSANAAYGFGKGAEGALSREQAMTLAVFTSEVLNEYMK